MATGKKGTRLSKVARELNVGISTLVEYLQKQNITIPSSPNTKIDEATCDLLEQQFKKDHEARIEADRVNLRLHQSQNESASADSAVSDEVDVTIPKAKKEQDKDKEKDKEKAKEKEKDKAKEEVEVSAQEVPPKEDRSEKGKAEKPKKRPATKEAEPTDKAVLAGEEAVEGKKGVKGEAVKSEEDVGVKEKKSNIPKKQGVRIVGKVNLDPPVKKEEPKEKAPKKETEPAESPKAEKSTSTKEPPKQKEDEVFKLQREKLNGPTVVGKIDLSTKDEGKGKGKGESASAEQKRKRKRKRIQKDRQEKVSVAGKSADSKSKGEHSGRKKSRKKSQFRKEVSEEDVQKQIKETLARLTSKGQKTKGAAKHRREKRQAISEKQAEEHARVQGEKNVLKVTEFVSVSEFASMMNIQPTQVIATCMTLGLFVSINQRLDAETMSLVASEFGYSVEFISVEVQEAIQEEVDDEKDLQDRSPIITVMGHVDHGKTSLLDYIRKANVIAGEAGGITQHIGAYNVKLESGRKITFLDTPGHEAFTAMRARGAQATDIVIIIVAADDNVMPQTIEAINHASAAGVPIVFAINKVDKPSANPDKIKEELAKLNYMIEEWGGKYQSHDISAKTGLGVNELLEKVLLEAEMLELKANPNKRAVGTIIESSLDKGRGYVTTILLEAGTLKIGDVVLAGQYFGHVKAMFNERDQAIKQVGPSEPALILGLNGAPQAGDKFNVMESEKEARQISNKREQLQREQGLRTQKHITLDEIGRRIAIGTFQELNVIVKGDVDGSIEALSDSLIKLSTEEIQINVQHKAVGQITESDVMLATASNAIIIGFQVRPSIGARKLAEKEQIDIRLYSIIYDAINELKSAMEGMLTPEIKEEISGTAEILETFKITKVGTIAGCIVRDGKINRNSKVRLIREGIVIYTGELESLKRFKEDTKEVTHGYECGLNIASYNDIKVGDFIEAFKEVEVSKSL